MYISELQFSLWWLKSTTQDYKLTKNYPLEEKHDVNIYFSVCQYLLQPKAFLNDWPESIPVLFFFCLLFPLNIPQLKLREKHLSSLDTKLYKLSLEFLEDKIFTLWQTLT